MRPYISGTCFGLWAFWLLTSAEIGRAAESPNIVDLDYAKYQGTVNSNTQNIEYLGIRYAAAPIGNLRWKQPQLPPKVGGVQQANAQPNRCYQALQGTKPRNPYRESQATNSGAQNTTVALQSVRRQEATTDLPPVSEDCLFLNVYVPGSSSGAARKRNLPVVVWIHGGGYILGAASTIGLPGTGGYDGNNLIQESGGEVVAVVIQYRLGVFGFLAGKDVKKNGALNAGLLDQQFALQWVQRHISQFGGDPHKVTIWGESAGAGSVLQHLIANDGHTNPPLFRGGILSSTFLPSQYRFDHRIPEAIYAEVLSQTGCATSSDALACLRQKDVDTLQAANVKINDDAFAGTFAFVPVIDGTLIRRSPTEAIQQGRVNTKHILAVTNTYEGRFFVDPSILSGVEAPDYIAQLFPLFGKQEIAAAAAQYQGLGSSLDQLIQIMGEAIFICPTYLLLRSVDGQAYKGHFAIPPANHGDDLAFYFPDAIPVAPFSTDFAKAFSGAFLDFVLNQDPNIKHDSQSILPTWTKWSNAGHAEMLFNRTGDLPDLRSVVSSADILKRCEFWSTVAPLAGQ